MPATVILNASSSSSPARARYPTSTRYPSAASNSREPGSKPASCAATLAVTSVVGLPAANSSNARRSWCWLALSSLSIVVCRLFLWPSPSRHLTSSGHCVCLVYETHPHLYAWVGAPGCIGRRRRGRVLPPSGGPTQARTTSSVAFRALLLGERVELEVMF